LKEKKPLKTVHYSETIVKSSSGENNNNRNHWLQNNLDFIIIII